jgi:hypothetical protein
MKHKSTFAFYAITALAISVATLGLAADKRLTKKELPAAVQKAADEQSKGATVIGYSSEVENGKTEYEVKLKVGDHTKDVSFDGSGQLLEIEEEVAFAGLPKNVQDGLKTAAGTGTLGKVESLTKRGKIVAYEAKLTTNGKRSEVQVGPKGEKLNHEE